jgi:hypothetical protein
LGQMFSSLGIESLVLGIVQMWPAKRRTQFEQNGAVI